MFYQAERKDLNVAITGDSLITRKLSPYTEPDFLALRDLIKGADAAFTNLEVVLGEAPDYPAEYCGGNWLGVPATLVDELTWMGFNLFSTANNHGGDFGTGGALSTIRELAARGLTHAGVGETLTRARQPGYLELGPARIAIVGTSASVPHGHAAGEQRQDMKGRPGVSPLRHETVYRLTPETFALLPKIAAESGEEAARTDRIARNGGDPPKEGEYKFLDARFAVVTPGSGEGPQSQQEQQQQQQQQQPGTWTEPNKKDLDDICKWIRDARRQADFVFASLHAHESNLTQLKPALFVEAAARAFIDAGADAVFGHGPHILRGIEMYREKPIFYSLGNFMMQSSTMQRLPADLYTRYKADAFQSTPADIFDNRLASTPIRSDPIYYESVLVRLAYRGGKVSEIKLHPIHLGTQSARPEQGRPILARGEMATKILEDVRRLSAPYGTEVRIEGEVGSVVLP